MILGVADRATAKEKAADHARADLVPVVTQAYEPPLLAARESAPTSELFSSRGGQTGKDEAGHAGVGVHDPRAIITAALKAAGLLSEPSGHPANRDPLDPRRIIATTLRSVGLLKE